MGTWIVVGPTTAATPVRCFRRGSPRWLRKPVPGKGALHGNEKSNRIDLSTEIQQEIDNLQMS